MPKCDSWCSYRFVTVPLASWRPAEVDPARQLGPDRLRGRPLVTRVGRLRSAWVLGPIQECRRGGIGRRTWFRSTRSQGRGGSSPSVGTLLSGAPLPPRVAGPHPRFWGPGPKTRVTSELVADAPLPPRVAGPHPRFWGPGPKTRVTSELVADAPLPPRVAGPHPRFWGPGPKTRVTSELVADAPLPPRRPEPHPRCWAPPLKTRVTLRGRAALQRCELALRGRCLAHSFDLFGWSLHQFDQYALSAQWRLFVSFGMNERD